MIAIAMAAGAKEKSSIFHSMQSSRNASYARDAAALEARLTPYLHRKLGHFNIPATGATRLRESDLFLLAKLWNSLSPEFKKLYEAASQIPTGYVYCVSPSGHFEVYYTTSAKLGGNVDPTDNYGFGVGGNWRAKTSQPNGVPDYVDEVAYALDSAWSDGSGRFFVSSAISLYRRDPFVKPL